jgi:hypothetical protein
MKFKCPAVMLLNAFGIYGVHISVETLAILVEVVNGSLQFLQENAGFCFKSGH